MCSSGRKPLNLTNTVLFAAPTTNMSSPGTFGAITSQTNFRRLFQISVSHHILSVPNNS